MEWSLLLMDKKKGLLQGRLEEWSWDGWTARHTLRKKLSNEMSVTECFRRKGLGSNKEDSVC